MNITVIGVGRLGLCFALLLDKAGHRVIGTDIRSNYVAALQRRSISTHEPQVQDLLQSCNIEFTTDTSTAIRDSDVIYVMVATPSLADGSYDVSAVERVISDLTECKFDLSDRVVVIGCTTNPGDCARWQQRLDQQGVHLLYNPEFIAQGSIIRDLQHADMVLIGGRDTTVIDRYKILYHDIQIDTPRVYEMSTTAAELVKIAVNCFLTTKISYANLVGEVLTRSGLEQDIDRALDAIGADSRVGPRYLKYGFGYGGPCLPRDNRAFAHYAKQIGLDFPLGTVVDEFNQKHTEFLAQYWMQKNPDLPFYIRSAAYKAGTDIYEESQQLRLVYLLAEHGRTVFVEHCDKMPDHVAQELQTRHGGLIQITRGAPDVNFCEIPT
jgi:UDPglucose 6-dehydrogenase